MADFGCGEAKLAEALGPNLQVHSFDLVAVNERVTVCDFSRTPLTNSSVDVATRPISLDPWILTDWGGFECIRVDSS